MLPVGAGEVLDRPLASAAWPAARLVSKPCAGGGLVAAVERSLANA
jgi:hypothetical protein